MPPFGLLNINKPTGLTSRRVVDHVQRLVRPGKAGHAGTLDPLASGVLVVCVGPATRLIDYVQRAAKRYTATFLLGRRSDTEDIEGVVTELDDPPVPTREEIERAADQFVGEIQQRPPAISALKVGGRRAYDLARAGEAVELKARPVTIYGIDLLEYDYPYCGSTSVAARARTFALLAASLGAAAVMSALRSGRRLQLHAGRSRPHFQGHPRAHPANRSQSRAQAPTAQPQPGAGRVLGLAVQRLDPKILKPNSALCRVRF